MSALLRSKFDLIIENLVSRFVGNCFIYKKMRAINEDAQALFRKCKLSRCVVAFSADFGLKFVTDSTVDKGYLLYCIYHISYISALSTLFKVVIKNEEPFSNFQMLLK